MTITLEKPKRKSRKAKVAFLEITDVQRGNFAKRFACQTPNKIKLTNYAAGLQCKGCEGSCGMTGSLDELSKFYAEPVGDLLASPYLKFLKSKIPQAEVTGFEPPSDFNETLKPHQRDICEWMIRGGRRAENELNVPTLFDLSKYEKPLTEKV